MEKRLSKMDRIALIDAMTELVNEKEALSVSLAEAKKAARETQDKLRQKEKELDESRRLMMQMQEQLISCRCRLAAAEAKLETLSQTEPQPPTADPKDGHEPVRDISGLPPIGHDRIEPAEAIIRIKRPKQEG